MSQQATYLLVRSGSRLCGLALAQVIEICRPLPIQTLAETPAFVLGLSRIRGGAVPVLDLRVLLGDPAGREGGRFVHLSVSERRVALAVDEVLGLQALEASALEALPPLLDPGSQAVEALASLDQSLLLILRSARLLPPEGLEAAAHP